MAPTAARRAKPVQRSSSQGLQGNPDACHPRRGSAWRDDHYGAPAEAQRSGFGGERRHSGGNELCRLRRSERSATCADEAGGNARLVSALCVQPTAAISPRTGGAGVEGAGGAFDVNLCEASFLKRREAPRPFFLPISSGRNGGARRVGGAGGASDKNPAKPPSKKRRVPGGTPANNGGGKPPPYSAWQFPRQPGFYQTGDHRSPLRTARRVVAPHGPAVAGADGRMISAPTGRGDFRCLVRAK